MISNNFDNWPSFGETRTLWAFKVEGWESYNGLRCGGWIACTPSMAIRSSEVYGRRIRLMDFFVPDSRPLEFQI
jgi:hypothetical protein